MQRLKLEMARRAPAQVSGADYNVKLPEREILRQKIQKTYATNGVPLELLLYYDNTNWLVGDVPAVPDFAEHARYVMQPLIDEQTQFRRVWVFERHRPSLLWKYPE
jgi:hypothetical protein